MKDNKMLPVEVEILMCIDSPQNYIDSVFKNITVFFNDVINDTTPKIVADAMEFIPDKLAWADDYIETLTSFIENLTPKFVSDLSWNMIFECDNKFTQSLYYRTYIIKKAIISSNEEIVETLEKGLTESLKSCIVELGKFISDDINLT